MTDAALVTSPVGPPEQPPDQPVILAKGRGPAHPLVHLAVTYADGSQEEWAVQEGCTAWLRKGVKRTTKPIRTWDYLEVHLYAPPGAILTPSASEQATHSGDG